MAKMQDEYTDVILRMINPTPKKYNNKKHLVITIVI